MKNTKYEKSQARDLEQSVPSPNESMVLFSLSLLLLLLHS